MTVNTTSEGLLAADEARVLEELRSASKLIVATHENPDGDSLGSLVAMHELLTVLGKDSVMFMDAAELPVPYQYRFLPLDRLVSELPADLAERTIVLLDCGNLERNAAEALQRPGGQIINIDHHHDNTRFGTANLVVPGASCTAEIVWELIHAYGVELTLPVAEALYVALVTDTGCFMYENTGPRAHVMAAELIDAGVDVHGIYRRVYEGVPFAKLQLLARMLAHIERYDDGGLTVSTLAVEDFEAAGAEESYSEGMIDQLRAVRGTAMAGLVRDRLDGAGAAELTADGRRLRKVSLRASDDRVDVSAVARVAGGGGHRAAAGFTTSLEWEPLVALLREQLALQLRSA